VDQQRKALVDQLRRINFYLLSLLVFLIVFNLFSVYTVYSQSNDSTTVKEKVEQNQDIISYLFSNSVTSMILSTFIIAIVGTLIAKLRNFKKKLDMIEILTKSQVKMKQQAEQREKMFEDRFIKSNDAVSKQINDLCEKMDKKTEQLEDKIDSVERNATATLIKYLSENAFDRKR
jgi:amino acid permease